MSNLTITQIQNFQTILVQREQQLQQEIEAVQQERAQELQGTDDLPHEPDANKSSDHADREIRHTEQFRDQQELLAVRAALKRIAEGVFGECVDCQKTIALPRLQATPAAMRCIACQTKFESKR